MKCRSIMFSTPMVQAILAGRKTQTRRIVKNYYPLPLIEEEGYRFKPNIIWNRTHQKTPPAILLKSCPYGQFGDSLLVRESHYRFGHWKKNGVTKTGKQKWKFVPVPLSDIYYEDDNLPEKANRSRVKGKEHFNLLYKRSSLYMPREASRIALEITGIRVEPLQDISQEDAKAEGVTPMPHRPASEGCKAHSDKSLQRDCFYCAYKILWNQINGDKGTGWDLNPWVWCIDFKQIKIPKNIS